MANPKFNLWDVSNLSEDGMKQMLALLSESNQKLSAQLSAERVISRTLCVALIKKGVLPIDFLDEALTEAGTRGVDFKTNLASRIEHIQHAASKPD